MISLKNKCGRGLLITITKGTPAAYTKSKLSDYYLGMTTISAIKDV